MHARTLAFDWPDANLRGAPVGFAGDTLIPMEKGAVAVGHVKPTLVANVSNPGVGFAAILEICRILTTIIRIDTRHFDAATAFAGARSTSSSSCRR